MGLSKIRDRVKARNENRYNLLGRTLTRKNTLEESPTGHRLVAVVLFGAEVGRIELWL